MSEIDNNDEEVQDVKPEIRELPGYLELRGIVSANGQLGVSIKLDNNLDPFAAPVLLEMAARQLRAQMGLSHG